MTWATVMDCRHFKGRHIDDAAIFARSLGYSALLFNDAVYLVYMDREGRWSWARTSITAGSVERFSAMRKVPHVLHEWPSAA